MSNTTLKRIISCKVNQGLTNHGYVNSEPCRLNYCPIPHRILFVNFRQAQNYSRIIHISCVIPQTFPTLRYLWQEVNSTKIQLIEANRAGNPEAMILMFAYLRTVEIDPFAIRVDQL